LRRFYRAGCANATESSTGYTSSIVQEVGGIHLQRPGELPKRGHARLDLVALDPGNRRRRDAGAVGIDAALAGLSGLGA
jgi:hypothetical protein